MGTAREESEMSRYIDADELERKYMSADYMDNDTAYDVIAELDTAPSIDLAGYVPKDFHDKTCEAMAKRHQEEIADMVSVVRCKECKWQTKDQYDEPYCGFHSIGIYADDFCSYGERSER